MCSDEIKPIIPLKVCYADNAQLVDFQNPFVLKLENTELIVNTFIVMTYRDWGELSPCSLFSYNLLQFFKTHVH